MELIERKAAEKEALIKKVESMTPNQFYRFIMAVCGAYLRQDAAPVVHGKLVSTGYDEMYCEFGNCTVCGADNYIKAKFCNWCGAKVDGGDGYEDN